MNEIILPSLPPVVIFIEVSNADSHIPYQLRPELVAYLSAYDNDTTLVHLITGDTLKSGQSMDEVKELVENKPKFTCSNCLGNGMCPDCNGSGVIVQVDLSDMEACPMCHGTGVCYKCGGTGYVHP